MEKKPSKRTHYIEKKHVKSTLDVILSDLLLSDCQTGTVFLVEDTVQQLQDLYGKTGVKVSHTSPPSDEQLLVSCVVPICCRQPSFCLLAP